MALGAPGARNSCQISSTLLATSCKGCFLRSWTASQNLEWKQKHGQFYSDSARDGPRAHGHPHACLDATWEFHGDCSKCRVYCGGQKKGTREKMSFQRPQEVLFPLPREFQPSTTATQAREFLFGVERLSCRTLSSRLPPIH